MNTDTVIHFLENHGTIEELKIFNAETQLEDAAKEKIEAHLSIAEALSNFHPEKLSDSFFKQLIMIEEKSTLFELFTEDIKAHLPSIVTYAAGIFLIVLLNVVFLIPVKLIGLSLCTSFIVYQGLKTKFLPINFQKE